jgi:hypothetical protein
MVSSTMTHVSSAPGNLVVTPGIENYGPDADYYRDTITGTVMNVSDLGTYMIGITRTVRRWVLCLM